MQADLEDLRYRIAAEEYEVDPQAVAGAILKRRRGGQPLSEVLVPAEVEGRAIRSEQAEPAPGGDVA